MLASFTTSLTVLALAASTPAGPQWESDYGKALKQTRADDRPLLVVIDGPEAKQQLAATMVGEQYGDQLNAYDLCRVTTDTEYGKRVADAFQAEQFPYVAIIDKSGTVILHSQTGQVSQDAWNTTLTKYQKGERPIRVTAAKPVIADSVVTQQGAIPYEGVIIESKPVISSPVYFSSPPSDCPNCRRGY